MRILCTSDWHAHNFSDFSRTISVEWDEKSMRYCEVEFSDNPHVRDMNSRLFNVLNAICDMRDYASNNEIRHILFAGDMFHHRGTIDVSVFNSVYKVLESFERSCVDIHAIAGNHDQVDNSLIPASALHSFKEIVDVIESPKVFSLSYECDKVDVVAVPYSKDKDFVLSSMTELRDKCSNPNNAILLCHLGVTGGKVGSGMYTMKDEYTLGELMYDKWHYVVCGHYHQPQLLDYNSFYCGTPVQNNFGDELKGCNGYNGFFVIDTNKRFDIQFVPIVAPRFITYESADDLDKVDPEFIKNNYVRVKSKSDQVDMIQSKLDTMLGECTQSVRLEIEKDYSVEHRSDVGLTQSPEETVRTYAKEHWNTHDTLEYAMSVGLDIMSSAMNNDGGK